MMGASRRAREADRRLDGSNGNADSADSDATAPATAVRPDTLHPALFPNRVPAKVAQWMTAHPATAANPLIGKGLSCHGRQWGRFVYKPISFGRIDQYTNAKMI
ncbi:protein of unknown function [Burkholderia multivorans]